MSHDSLLKKCASCSGGFTITTDDFAFYDKIKVSPPTWCPACRAHRRMSNYPNLFGGTLFRRKCDATGKSFFSFYAPDNPFPVYDREYWYSDKWDATTYAQEYDFEKPFFLQFSALQKKVPRYHTLNLNSTNCDYCAAATNSRDSYLSNGFETQDCMYLDATYQDKECVDGWFIIKSELCYECLHIEKCYNVAFSQFATNCTDSSFLYDCADCTNCFGCVNLRHKSYYIFNKPYTREAYFKEIERFDLGSFETLQKFEKKFSEFKKGFPAPFARLINCTNVTGDNVSHANECKNCYEIFEADHCTNVTMAGLGLTDTQDGYDVGSHASLMYEITCCGSDSSRIFFSSWVLQGSTEVYYSDNCINCSNIFGCVGLNKKQYCILNRQYTKEEYETLVPKIIQHMTSMPYHDTLGRVYSFGEYFPSELSPFYYSDTVAQQYIPLQKSEVHAQGFRSRVTELPETTASATLFAETVPDHITDAPDSVPNEIIKGQCGHKFKILKKEFAFYKKQKLSLPRLCPHCRFLKRVTSQNPQHLWERPCGCAGGMAQNGMYQNLTSHFHGADKCPNIFQTTFAPDRPEAVYCKECFSSELI